MIEKGKAIMGLGISEGEGRAIQAAQSAIASPLLDDVSIKGAKGLLINISGSDITLAEMHEAASLITKETDSEPKIITGLVVDEDLGNKIKVMVVATGISEIPFKETPIEPVRAKENLEFPTFKRNEIKKEIKEKPYNANDLEVPTFLRRQID
jgi:cell division protein FtsZ